MRQQACPPHPYTNLAARRPRIGSRAQQVLQFTRRSRLRCTKKAGGPTNRPIYIAIDDNPTREQYTRQIRPYLQAFSKTLELAGYQAGVYGNYNTIEWAIQDGIGKYFWMHDWGSNGKIHPRTTIHQLPHSKQQTIGGVIVDVNEVYADDWGQWTPGKSAAPAPAKKPTAKDSTADHGPEQWLVRPGKSAELATTEQAPGSARATAGNCGWRDFQWQDVKQRSNSPAGEDRRRNGC